MKKNIILLGTVLAIASVLIIGFTTVNITETNNSKSIADKTIAIENQTTEDPNRNGIPVLYYGVDTRFAAVKKSDIAKAKTIYAFLNEGEKEQIAHINSVRIIVIENNQQSNKQEYSSDENLTNAQLQLIKSLDYFNHFTIRTEFKEKNKETGKLDERFFGPHITVVPDTQAIYVNGKEALINYLKEHSKDNMNVIKDEKLGAIKLSFIITKEGEVSNVKHDAMTTGYPSIDEKFMKLIKNIPGKWIPAENANGEKMEQELVFTFGPRDGC
ncbi:hypothetical protein [Winogradskyella sp.]|uniref:hypothetical protein n=1 Tax=Winogradskyella sp. TaxID=1883156 RepID=UPI0025E46F75|nr:hypothetical protein [Winogradskyella sp.]